MTVPTVPQIQSPPAAAACDTGLVGQIVALTNAAYAIAEAGFWRAGAVRTTRAEIAEALRRGQIITATAGDRVVGVVRVDATGSEGTFGMLAVAPQYRGAGVGRRLVQAAEAAVRERGGQSVRIEVVMPTAGDAAKEALGRWYESLGYQHVGSAGLAEHYPGLEQDLVIACHLEIYRRPLGP